MTERDPRKQLVTARAVLALFENQIAEYDAMNREQRRQTPRGRDLSNRHAELIAGHKTWTARVAHLETQTKGQEPTT